jgi:hypothetical protein
MKQISKTRLPLIGCYTSMHSAWEFKPSYKERHGIRWSLNAPRAKLFANNLAFRLLGLRNASGETHRGDDHENLNIFHLTNHAQSLADIMSIAHYTRDKIRL